MPGMKNSRKPWRRDGDLGQVESIIEVNESSSMANLETDAARLSNVKCGLFEFPSFSLSLDFIF